MSTDEAARETAPTCPIHARALICPACTGQAGGQASTPKKAAAVRANAEKARAKRHPAKPSS